MQRTSTGRKRKGNQFLNNGNTILTAKFSKNDNEYLENLLGSVEEEAKGGSNRGKKKYWSRRKKNLAEIAVPAPATTPKVEAGTKEAVIGEQLRKSISRAKEVEGGMDRRSGWAKTRKIDGESLGELIPP